jgi:hypothetical protein
MKEDFFFTLMVWRPSWAIPIASCICLPSQNPNCSPEIAKAGKAAT